MSNLKRRGKSALRGMADRAMVPYVDQLAEEIRGNPSEPGGLAGDGNVPSDFFHNLLHELRTIELERSRGDRERIVSVGASGRWYFDWVEQAVGEVSEHVGLEAFEPKPADLPDYATWIATTADRFDGVDDDSVDLVYAGQTTEHLWAEELAAFLIQSQRVLRRDGAIVLDSPNRLVTEHLHWSHGGHSIELSPAEITELVELAGFEVTSMRGVWRCRFGEDVLELEDRLDHSATLVRRIVDGPDAPDDCFVWWLIARPAGEPDPAAVRARAEELYAEHQSTRICRGMWPGPGSSGPAIARGGQLRVASLPFMLRAGRYRIGVCAAEGDPGDIAAASLELSLPGDNVVHHLTLADAEVDADGIWWEVDHRELSFALSLVVHVQEVTAPVRLAMPLSITTL